MNDIYKKQVGLLIKIVPLLYRIKEFDSTDKEFLLSFEMGEPNWEKCCAGDLSEHPSVKWKLQNIQNLKSSNAAEFSDGVMKLRNYFEL